MRCARNTVIVDCPPQPGSANTKRPNDRLSGGTHLVMPANAGIHDFLGCDKAKSWIPAGACPLRRRGAGMTSWAKRRWVNL
jgi:hypothetical protein